MMSTSTPPVRRKTARLTALAVGIVMLAFVGLLATRSPISEGNRPSQLLGKIAPDISGPRIDNGEIVTLASLRAQNKYVLLNFFGSYCVPCRQEHPELVKIEKEFASDVAILGVLFEDDVSKAREFMEREGGGWPVIESSKTAVDFGVPKIPETFLIAPTGEVIFKASGSITRDRFAEAFTQVKVAAQ